MPHPVNMQCHVYIYTVGLVFSIQCFVSLYLIDRQFRFRVSLHTSVRSLRFLHHLVPAALGLGGVNRIETYTSVCNL